VCCVCGENKKEVRSIVRKGKRKKIESIALKIW
jgi:hypothetical protein